VNIIIKLENVYLFSAGRSSLAVDIEPKRETAVRSGETLTILCKAGKPLRVCRVEIPGISNAMVLTKGDPAEDGIEYFGDGMLAGHCGIQIAKVKENHDGIFKCFLTANDSRQEATASLKIIVASESLSFISFRRNSD
jgi:hypothetical protein